MFCPALAVPDSADYTLVLALGHDQESNGRLLCNNAPSQRVVAGPIPQQKRRTISALRQIFQVNPWLVLAAAALALACVGCREQPAAATPAAYAALQATATVILATHCGTCHEESLPTARMNAVRVYNLENPDWPNNLTADRMDKALERLKSPLGEEGLPRHVPQVDIANFRKFVQAWKQKRDAK